MANLHRFIGPFSSEERKKCQGSKSGEYGGRIITVLFLAKNEQAGGLS